MITDSNGNTLFTADELRCQSSGKLRLADGFAEALRDLRMAVDEPMVVNSCCRSAEHNQRVGGHPRSLHVCDEPAHPTGGTCAIDIAAEEPAYRARVIGVALEEQWSVGIHPKFIHLDLRAEILGLPQVVFLY